MREPAVPRRACRRAGACPGPQLRAGRLDIGDGVRDLLYAGAVAVQELGDRGVGEQRGEQLDASAGRGRADRQHRLTHALLLIGLLMHAPHAEDASVELDGRVQVGHRDADVIDAQQADACDGLRSELAEECPWS